MNQSETLRQQKVASQIQRDISDIFARDLTSLAAGTLISITKVRMSPDLALAKVYLSIFPFAKSQETIKRVSASAATIRHLLGAKVRNQLRIVPEVAFFVDDSMEYAENIDRLLKI